MSVRAAHRAAVGLTVRDITVWFRFGDSSRGCGQWCGRAPCEVASFLFADWAIKRNLLVGSIT